MTRLLGRRIVHAVPVVVLVSFITFALMNLLPGGAPLALLGEQATPQSVRALDIKLHLNEPFFTRYVNWLGSFFSGHLGASLATGQSVSSILRERLPITLELGILSLVVAVVFSMAFALLATAQRGRLFDRINTTVNMVGLAIPNFVFALLLVLVFAGKLHWLPSSGFVPLGHGIGQNLRSMVLPTVALAFGLICVYGRVLRGDLVDEMTEAEYVMVARAKGVSERRILYTHALRNSSFGFLTLIGLNLGTLLGGALLIEEIFSLPGMGQELVQAITYRDTPVVEVFVVLLAVAVIAANLLTDIVYAILDPRIRYEHNE